MTTITSPARYNIIAFGHLDESWSSSLSGMSISVVEQPDGSRMTQLTGDLVDQAALLGILNALYNLGFTLESVERDEIESNADA